MSIETKDQEVVTHFTVAFRSTGVGAGDAAREHAEEEHTRRLLACLHHGLAPIGHPGQPDWIVTVQKHVGADEDSGYLVYNPRGDDMGHHDPDDGPPIPAVEVVP